MAFSYNKLWKKTIDLGLNKTMLRDKAKITNQSLSRLSKDRYVSMDVLNRICIALNCDISEIVEFVSESESYGENGD